MTIATELTKLETNLSNAYDALVSKGATISGNKNFDNLSIDVESIPGLDGLGRELRAAYAYTCETPAQGKHTICTIQNDIFYESPLYDDLTLSAIYKRFVSGGNAYTFTISNSEMVITQQGTYTDWNYSYSNNFGIRNNKLFPTNLSTEELISYIPQFNTSGFNDSALIFNGKLYNNGELIDDTGVWTSVATDDDDFYGIRDGYYTIIKEGNLYICYDVKVKNNLIFSYYDYSGVNVVDNALNIKRITFSNNVFKVTDVKKLTKTPKKICSTYTDNYIILYEDDTVEVYHRGGLVTTYENCKNISIYYSFSLSSVYFVILYNNGDLYRYQVSGSTSSNTNINAKLIKNIGSNAALDSFITYLDSSSYNFKISYLDNVSISETLYIPSVVENTAYYNVGIQSSKKTITSKTNTSITVGGKTYIRDISKDSYFAFVPEELANHTFTDQEVCQAALLAGL